MDDGSVKGDPVVSRSALKHGILAEDALHAYRNSIRRWILDEGFMMHIGPSRSGTLIEVGVVDRERSLQVVHAMMARDKFLPKG